MNRIDRISAILIHLQSKKIVRAQDIADRFEISLRTVYRDIASLNEAGIPIIGEAGTGYSLAEGYRLPPVMFTVEEATAFLTAEKLIEKLTDKKTFSIYQSAMYKIRAILRSAEKNHLEGLEEHIEVINNPYLPVQPQKNEFLQDILKSITLKSVVHISYFANHSQQQSSRDIEPVGIFFSSGHWHLVAFCLLRNDYRNFRIDRIHSVTITQVPFQKKHPSLKTYLKNMVQNKDELFHVVMTMDKKHVRYLGDQKYFMGYVSEVDKGDFVEFTFLTASLEGFARWYLMFGDSAKIISPVILKAMVFKIGQSMMKNVE